MDMGECFRGTISDRLPGQWGFWLSLAPLTPEIGVPQRSVVGLDGDHVILGDRIESPAAAGSADVAGAWVSGDGVGEDQFVRRRPVIGLIEPIPFAVGTNHAQETSSALQHQVLALGWTVEEGGHSASEILDSSLAISASVISASSRPKAYTSSRC